MDDANCDIEVYKQSSSRQKSHTKESCTMRSINIVRKGTSRNIAEIGKRTRLWRV